MIKKTVFLLLLVLSELTQAKTLLTVCYETDDLSPFIKASADPRLPVGILVDMLSAAAQPLDIELQFHQAPWLRCQKMVQQNQFNATLAMIWTPQRGQLFRFPDRQSGVQQSERFLWQAHYQVFSPIDKPFSLQQYQPKFGIGAPLGYIVEDWLYRKGWLSPYKFSLDTGLQMVADGKLDGYSVERFIGQHRLQTIQLEQHLAASNDNLLVEKWFLVFNQQYYLQNASRTEQLWSNISKVRKSFEAQYPYPDSSATQ